MKYTPPNFKETVGPELIQEENLYLWLNYRSEREREREREREGEGERRGDRERRRRRESNMSLKYTSFICHVKSLKCCRYIVRQGLSASYHFLCFHKDQQL